ncbi:hypothetical protein KI387_034646 [Taxus chinensis]|uniref:TPD1 protein homolog 1-like n=1 Tax=Taxus chinensis TaxID=29808 RepID=A0AA38F2Z6_TAXCH|nr:hypothetical protein KI387_034646 [Taxus chinensis]
MWKLSVNNMSASVLFAVYIFLVCVCAVSGISVSGHCSEHDMVVTQGNMGPRYNGIPGYLVSILNVCTTGCSISNVHLSCGWFASAIEINPATFKRLKYNDCLVNGGKPIKAGQTVYFTYANTFPCTLKLSAFTCS